jgi:hypothetical protein
MLKQELLKPTENLAAGAEEPQNGAGGVTRAEAGAIFRERKNLLEEIRAAICLKFYNEISEKLESENSRFERMLNVKDARDEVLSQYSFVLNPYYFEQKFLAEQI